MRGSKPGERRGGRQKGTPNRETAHAAEILARLDCDPITTLALITMAKVPCGLCDGKGTVPDKSMKKKEACPGCAGSGREPIAIGERMRAAAELAGYVHPKRKAIEVKAPDGKGDVELADLLVVLRRAQRG